ncbi:MAG: glycine--tRNA ligase [Alphaproteobacteria bacterium]|jgi:glycyl-tRNA synthetase|nr:glycine--tRNA ligase [Alphaproteobacteria bacterium]
MSKPETSLMSRLVSLCKRRGFIYPASEIYGGLNGFWDFGPLGSQLKNNLRDRWWYDMVECPPLGPDGKPLTIVGLDSTIIQHPRTWHASGHVGGFADFMVDCRETKLRYRADHVLVLEVSYEKGGVTKSLGLLSALEGDEFEASISKKAKKMVQKSGGGELLPIDSSKAIPLTNLPAEQHALVIGPDAETAGTLTEPRAFNLMFHSYVGVFQDEDSKVYLRPETAQGIFLQYKNILDTSRVKIPFGVAQVGKSFRNEVTPRNFIFRSREFEQMEMEFFCPPEDGMMWYEFWVAERMRWWESVGCAKENLYRHIIPENELAHYSKGTSDIEYRWPFTAPGFGELEGVAYRTDYDLTQHSVFSKQKLDYIDQENNRRYTPHVVEPASGLTRGVLLLLSEAYQYDESRPSPEWLKLKPSLAPIKLGIFPLVNKDGMPEVAEKIFMDLRRSFTCQYDAKQSIGKRYARMDEIGTPFCITVDGESLNDQCVTIRNRDTAQSERVSIDKIREYVAAKLVD